MPDVFTVFLNKDDDDDDEYDASRSIYAPPPHPPSPHHLINVTLVHRRLIAKIFLNVCNGFICLDGSN